MQQMMNSDLDRRNSTSITNRKPITSLEQKNLTQKSTRRPSLKGEDKNAKMFEQKKKSQPLPDFKESNLKKPPHCSRSNSPEQKSTYSKQGRSFKQSQYSCLDKVIDINMPPVQFFSKRDFMKSKQRDIKMFISELNQKKEAMKAQTRYKLNHTANLTDLNLTASNFLYSTQRQSVSNVEENQPTFEDKQQSPLESKRVN